MMEMTRRHNKVIDIIGRPIEKNIASRLLSKINDNIIIWKKFIRRGAKFKVRFEFCYENIWIKSHDIDRYFMPFWMHFFRSEHIRESLHRQEREIQQASARDK
jgi:hypothetical protein